MSVEYFGVTFNDTTMLHEVYGGEQGLPVNAGNFWYMATLSFLEHVLSNPY